MGHCNSTTVGYGDTYPTTQTGRIFASLLLVVGVGLFSVLTSYITTNLFLHGQKEQERKIERMSAGLEEIKRLLLENEKW